MDDDDDGGGDDDDDDDDNNNNNNTTIYTAPYNLSKSLQVHLDSLSSCWTYRYSYAVIQVTCQGHIIGGILAETKTQAQRAAKAVKVTYEDLEPIITIDVRNFTSL